MAEENPLTLSRAPGTTHYLVLIAAQLAVGSAAILARAGLSTGLSPIGLSAWRLGVAAIILCVGLAIRSRGKARTRVPHRDVAWLVVAGILLGLHFAAWFASLERISVARSTLLVCTCPLWAGMAEALFFRERPGRGFWLGLGIAGIGGYLVMATWSQGAFHPDAGYAGESLAIVGAISIAAYLLIAQRIQDRLGSARMIGWTYSLAAMSLWPVVLLIDSPRRFVPHSSAAWFSILGMALIPQLIGHTALNWSLRRFTAGAVAAATLLEPVFASALAWWLLSEAVTSRQALGGIVLLGGVGLALRFGRRSD